MIFKKINLLILLLLTNVFAQQKITVEAIYTGQFQPKGMVKLQSMKNTNQYTVLNSDETTKSVQIDLFDFATLKKVSTILDTKNQSTLSNRIDSYTFSPNENTILIANSTKQIYRRSASADYFLFTIGTKELTKILEQVQEPTFSPDGKKIGYVKENNIFIYDIESNTNRQITTDGKKNAIINGITDWVYEEEFGFVRAFDWSKDSKKIAYIRFDETQVPEFTMSVFGKDLYPKVETFKYPKAGEKNSLVSLHLYNVDSQIAKKVDLSQYNDFYIPRIEWSSDANILSAKILNRHQDNLDLWKLMKNSWYRQSSFLTHHDLYNTVKLP